MPAKKTKEKGLHIEPLEFEFVTLQVLGIRPLIVHA